MMGNRQDAKNAKPEVELTTKSPGVRTVEIGQRPKAKGQDLRGGICHEGTKDTKEKTKAEAGC